MMFILIEEEYGYRTWLWRYPHDKKQLIADWKSGKAPLNFYDPSYSNFDGKLTQIKADTPFPIVLSSAPYLEAKDFEEAKKVCDA